MSDRSAATALLYALENLGNYENRMYQVMDLLKTVRADERAKVRQADIEAMCKYCTGKTTFEKVPNYHESQARWNHIDISDGMPRFVMCEAGPIHDDIEREKQNAKV